MNTIHI